MALNSASKSSSSADPPRSPLNVKGRFDLMPPTGALTVGSALLSVCFTGDAKTTSTVFVSGTGGVFSFFLFHGGNGRSFTGLLGFAVSWTGGLGSAEDGGGGGASDELVVVVVDVVTEPGSVSSSVPSPDDSNLSVPLEDMAMSSARRSASLALPPRSPLNVKGKTSLPPF